VTIYPNPRLLQSMFFFSIMNLPPVSCSGASFFYADIAHFSALLYFIMPNRYSIIKRVLIFFQSKHRKNRIKIYMYTKLLIFGPVCMTDLTHCVRLNLYFDKKTGGRLSTLFRLFLYSLFVAAHLQRRVCVVPVKKPDPLTDNYGSSRAATPTRPGPVLRARVAAICLL
jgi:hypothetical protein